MTRTSIFSEHRRLGNEKNSTIDVLDALDPTHGDKCLEEKNQKEEDETLTDERSCKA
jgi:hypothetical protein